MQGMRYSQEKYNEVKIATGYYNMSNKTIDRILLSFATVPQVTLEEATEMHCRYLSANNINSTYCEDFRDAVNVVLAKREPVIEAKPEPTITLVDAAEGRSLEVPASVVHEMAYQEAVMYDPMKSNYLTSICGLCSAVVVDQTKHTAWHGTQQG